MSVFIKGATILAMGGSAGSVPFTGDVLIDGDRIAAIGRASPTRRARRLSMAKTSS